MTKPKFNTKVSIKPDAKDRAGFGAHRAKFENAVLYFSANCKSGTVGKVKLAKLLYYLDFDHYETHLESVTNSVYQHLPEGPVPAQFFKWIQNMEAEKKIEVKMVPLRGNKQQHLIIPMVSPDLSVFSHRELNTLKNVTSYWHGATAEQIKQAAHLDLPYDLTRPDEIVPIQLARFRHAT